MRASVNIMVVGKVAFPPSLAAPTNFGDQSAESRYTVKLVVQKDGEEAAKLLAAAEEVGKNVWGKDWQNSLLRRPAQQVRFFLYDGDDPKRTAEKYQQFAGYWHFSASNKERPDVFIMRDGRTEPVPPEGVSAAEKLFKPGSIVAASLNIWGGDTKFGPVMSAYVRGISLLRPPVEGDPIAEFASHVSADDFDNAGVADSAASLAQSTARSVAQGALPRKMESVGAQRQQKAIRGPSSAWEKPGQESDSFNATDEPVRDEEPVWEAPGEWTSL